jgi:hypothetical protein
MMVASDGDKPTDLERPSPRPTHQALILVIAAFVAFVAAFLAYAGGANVANAALTGGSAACGAVTMLNRLLNGFEDNR